MWVLLTGMSGTGKSAVVEELRRRGHPAYDADDGYAEPRADGRWGWRLDDVARLLTERPGGLQFFAGCSEEQGSLPFDRRVLLSAPGDVLAERLRTRTSNSYGRAPAELAQVLADLVEVEPLLRATAELEVDTSTASAGEVADVVLRWLGGLVKVRRLEPDAADDAATVGRISGLVNEVYAEAERGLWLDGAERTAPDEVAAVIRSGEGVVATLDGHIVGSLRLRGLDADTGEFGVLAADPTVRGLGVGSALVAFALAETRRRGRRAMQLEVLVPRDWSHPGKDRLRAWYQRLGFALVRTEPFEDEFAHLAPLLATPCDLEVYQRAL